MEDIQGFTFYKNYYEIIKHLPNKEKILLYDAILEYMFENKETELNGLLNGIWINIKMPLDNNKKNIVNGKKGGRPKTQKEPKKNPKETEDETQKEPKTKANNISYFLFLISNNNYKYIKENNNIYNKIIEWLKYKQERKELYKETGLNSLLKQIENNIDKYGEDVIINLISECMANNYKGIIFEKLEKIKQESKSKPNWLNKQIEESKASTIEIKKLEERLNKF